MKNSSLPKTDHLIGNLLQKKRNRNRHFGCWRNLFWLSSYKCYSNYLTMSQNRNNRHPRLVISLLVSCLIGGKTQNSSGACNKVLILSSFNGVIVIIAGFTVTLHFTTLVCYCQNGGVSAKLSIPGSLVSGPSGADGVFTCPPWCGGAWPQPEQGPALHLPPTRTVL